MLKYHTLPTSACSIFFGNIHFLGNWFSATVAGSFLMKITHSQKWLTKTITMTKTKTKTPARSYWHFATNDFEISITSKRPIRLQGSLRCYATWVLVGKINYMNLYKLLYTCTLIHIVLFVIHQRVSLMVYLWKWKWATLGSGTTLISKGWGSYNIQWAVFTISAVAAVYNMGEQFARLSALASIEDED